MKAPAPSAAPAEFIPVENDDTSDSNGGKLEPSGASGGSSGIGSTAYILIGAGGLVLVGSALFLRRRKPEESTEAAEGDESTDVSPPATDSAAPSSVV